MPHRFGWTVSAGRIDGDGSSVRWNLDAAPAGLQTATVRIEDSAQGTSDCSLVVLVKTPDRGSSLPRESSRSLLVQGHWEQEGYGLYSYLLLGAPPTDKTRERYVQVTSAYWDLLPSVEDIEAYLPRSALNVTYLPVTVTPGRAATAHWALEHYDYARARALLRTLSGDHRDGPYIVSVQQPIALTEPLTAPYLYQDLSSVPPQLASAWIKEFLNQAAQERFSDARAAPQLALRLRTTLAVAAMGVEPVMKSLDTIISWIPKPS